MISSQPAFPFIDIPEFDISEIPIGRRQPFLVLSAQFTLDQNNYSELIFTFPFHPATADEGVSG